MSHWDATLIYYTISALENSNKFFKVILWLSLLMFSFIPTLLSIIPSSSPPKHSDTSSLCSVLACNMHRLCNTQKRHAEKDKKTKRVKFAKVLLGNLLGVPFAGSTPACCPTGGGWKLQSWGMLSSAASSTGHKIMGMFRASEKANPFCWATRLFVLSLRIWLVYPKETTNQQHYSWRE